MTETSQGPRQTLAMRLAERQRQRDLRAERLARLRTATPEAALGVASGVNPGPLRKSRRHPPCPLRPLRPPRPRPPHLPGPGRPRRTPQKTPQKTQRRRSRSSCAR